MQIIFEWDEGKAGRNLRKHKVSFQEAKTVFNDAFLVTFSDEKHSNSEDRCVSIGYSAINRLLIVVHTERGATGAALTVRIISCRKATAAERKVYEEGEN